MLEHRWKIPHDQGLVAIVLALLGFGLVMVFSASTAVSGELYGSQTRVFTRQLLSVILGLLVLLATMKIDYRLYQKRAVVYPLLLSSLGLLIFLAAAGEHGGARRWINLGVTGFQPSELAKLTVVIFTSWYLVTRKEGCRSFKRGLIPYMAVVGPVVLLVLLEPDLGTAVGISVTACFLLFLGGLPYRYLAALCLLSIPSLYFLIVRVPYRFNRILAFLDPDKDPYGVGYQIHQSLISMGSGGWNGLGYAQGKQKLFFLPEPHTDFIYSVIGEELGFLGCFAMLTLFALFYWRGARIALRAESDFGTYLGLGVVGMIVLQALINMSVAVSLLPTKGLPLPFVSVGGSSMIVTLAAVGILLNISRDSSRPRQPDKPSRTHP